MTVSVTGIYALEKGGWIALKRSSNPSGQADLYTASSFLMPALAFGGKLALRYRVMVAWPDYLARCSAMSVSPLWLHSPAKYTCPMMKEIPYLNRLLLSSNVKLCLA